MKRKSLLLAFLILILTTGCGNKKLTCTLKEDTQSSTLKFTFKDDKADKVTMSVKMKLDEELEDSDIDKRVEELQNYYDKNGYDDVKVKAKGKNINISVSMDAKKFMALTDDEDLSYDDLRKELEDEEYTCK